MSTKSSWQLRQCSLLGTRESNEDILLAELLPVGNKGIWLCVASDGMGGMEGGEQAARECAGKGFVTAKKILVEKGKSVFYTGGGAILYGALNKIDIPISSAMGGATFVLLAVSLDRFKNGYRAIMLWAGDSRAWLLDAETNLLLLTTDDVDEIGHLTAFYDAASGRFIGGLHLKEMSFPYEPLAFGVSTDGFHESCAQNELRSFLAYNILQPERDFAETTQNFIEINLADNATCGFVLRNTRLPKNVLEEIVRGKR